MTNLHFRGSLFTRTLPALAMTGALAFGVTACGSDDESDSVTTGGGGSSQAADTAPAAEVKDATGGITRVTLDSKFAAALGTLKVTPGVIGDTKLRGSTLSFPITSGNVKYYDPTGPVQPYVQGQLDHDNSGFSLSIPDTKVDLEDFVIDPGTSTLTGKVSVNGEVAAESTELFFLDGRTLEPLRAVGDKAILEGTTVKLKAGAAKLLNDTFKIDALTDGMTIGVAKITVPTGAAR